MIDLNKYKNSGMPWVDAIIKELEECRTENERLNHVIKSSEVIAVLQKCDCDFEGPFRDSPTFRHNKESCRKCVLLAKYSGPSKAGSGE